MSASVEVSQQTYRELLNTARRFTRSEDEARDLAQDAVLLALARGFVDWSAPSRRAWLRGLLRKRAAFIIRGQERRRRREVCFGALDDTGGSRRWVWRTPFLETLPPSLRVLAVLVSADLCAAEICWLLGLNNTALRQRSSALRRRVAAEAEPPTQDVSEGGFSFGGWRTRVLESVRRQHGRVFAAHDPDGHTILLRVGPHNQSSLGNR